MAGAGGLSLAAGCTSKPEKTLYSLVTEQEDMVAGQATWYASTCRECPAGCGILAKNREGRVIKVEGNPVHPINRGKLCMRGQAALQGLYDPDRIRTPLLKEKDGWRPLTYPQAIAMFKQRAKKAAEKGREKVRLLTEVVGENLMGLFADALELWGSGPPLVFEPYAYESLKTANQRVFGVDGLPSYRMEGADMLVSLGADFLETWLSPVSYAGKFKEMHAFKDGQKGLFVHIGPYQSLTCANADLWVSCRPGTEKYVALGLIGEALKRGRGLGLPEKVLNAAKKISSPYTGERVAELSGIPLDVFKKLGSRLLGSKRPLILPGGTGGTGADPVQADIAANVLNLILDPRLSLMDFHNRHRVEVAARRSEAIGFFERLEEDPVDLLLINNANPAYALPQKTRVKEALQRDSLFVVSLGNFMDETTALADLILPVRLPLETWDEYGGTMQILSTLQPAMGGLTGAPHIGDLFIGAASGMGKPFKNYQAYLYARLSGEGRVSDEEDWLKALQQGGIFETRPEKRPSPKWSPRDTFEALFGRLQERPTEDPVFIAAPSIRFFDGRGANRPWVSEVPDPLTKVAWQTPVLIHPETLALNGLKQGDLVEIQSEWGRLEAPVYETPGVRPGVLVSGIGQGHTGYGRYADGVGVNPSGILSPGFEPDSGGPLFSAGPITLRKTGKRVKLAHTDGSRTQQGRKIAVSVPLKELGHKALLTLPLPGGYDPKKDFYPAHSHEDYRWVMVIDLDRCIGCGACAVACYAENNVGVVGLERVLEGREMSWLRVERYQDRKDRATTVFLPMLCQHCDNAPCESVCPVYATHHSKEGLNNQIYNRCIGTRFCAQNCPYKVRRFNWFDWQRPKPAHLQLNPDVTVRSKGVMEKCSFCVQRIKEAHGIAKNEGRKIDDGEVRPACLQTCPTGAFTFGNLMDKGSRVRKMVEGRRAYQVLEYLNTKPAVIYLKKVVQEI